MSVVDKKVIMNLVGLDGNAFGLLGSFVKNAKKQGWTPQESDAVVKEATSGDYDHLLQTLIKYTTTKSGEKS